MSHVAKTPFDLTLHLVSVGGNSDGGWIPGNGYPNPQVGRIGQRYVDVQTGHVYGPKTRDGWPAEYTHTLNLGNVAGEFANMLSRVPALEVRAANLEARTTVLGGRADSAADLTIQHHATLQEHDVRIETLEADSLEVRRRLGMVDSTLSSRMLAAEDALSTLSRLRGEDVADTNSRLDTLTTELNGNKSSLTTLQDSYTSMSQTWTQQMTTLRSEFDDNIATLEQTLSTQANQFSATAELVTTLTSRVDNNQAAISTESRTRADALSALSEQISQLSAETASSAATLTSKQTAMADELEAYASSVLTLNASIGQVSAAVTQEASTRASVDGYLGSRYTLNVTNSAGGVASVAGMEIANTYSGGKQTTNYIVFFADRFYITHSSSNVVEAPFIVSGGEVYIKSAIIQDASITSAKIQDAAITSAKIGSAAVDTLKIAGNAVTVPVIATSHGYEPTATIYLSEPGYVMAIATANLWADFNSASAVSLDINGHGVVAISVAEYHSTALTACHGFNLPAGSHTFRANIGFRAGYFNIQNCSLVLMGAKR